MSRPTVPAQPGFDARRFKAMERAGFNRIAARYADGAHLRADLAAALLDAAALAPGQRVPDLASGPGLLAGQAALRVAPGGVVLDPCAGSGTTLEAALVEGVRSIGIEREADYLPLIEQRIARAHPPLDFTEATA